MMLSTVDLLMSEICIGLSTYCQSSLTEGVTSRLCRYGTPASTLHHRWCSCRNYPRQWYPSVQGTV